MAFRMPPLRLSLALVNYATDRGKVYAICCGVYLEVSRPGSDCKLIMLMTDLLAVLGDMYEGFDNLPHIMGSTSRRRNKVTGFASGWVEGGKRISWGMYDGAVGLVVDPLDGALREGPKGFVKGCGRGGKFRPVTSGQLPS
jgi:hypothetical protein